VPTADELWQHADYIENPSGGVTQLVRGATLGSTPYNRNGGSHLVDIRYTATNVTVLVDGVEQINMNGSFPDGRFGVYTIAQGPPASFANFEVLSTDFAGLSATVDRSNGNITIRNAGGVPVEFDYYQFDSASGSLSTGGWNSLSDQNFQPAGTGAHQRWQEAGGSSAAALAEAFLDGKSTLAANATINLGSAYNSGINGEDLVLRFRLPSGHVLNGAVQYVGTAVGLTGDYNSNGVVDAADYVVWRKNLGQAVNLPNDSTPGNVTQADYDVWRANFGRPVAGSGAALATVNVPEPTGFLLATCAGLFVVGSLKTGSRRMREAGSGGNGN
jgi:hypothetical protein